MDSVEHINYYTRLTGNKIFQLHVMDSWGESGVFLLSSDNRLSTPCNGFVTVNVERLESNYMVLSTPCNGFPGLGTALHPPEGLAFNSM